MNTSIVKARKIHKCDVCSGHIQKGEKYRLIEERLPTYDYDDNQAGVQFTRHREHNKDCFPRLLHFNDSKNILKNCNFGVHSPTYDMDPDSYDDTEWCKWCGKILHSTN